MFYYQILDITIVQLELQYSKQTHPQMDLKKNSGYMQKAIQKASKLIDLLTRQNTELKEQNITFTSQLQQHNQEVQALNQQNQQLQQMMKVLSIKLEEKEKEVGEMGARVREMEGKLEEKGGKNKQLYEKLGEYATKNQELLKNLEKEKKRNLSLQNENQYLVKTFTVHELKENQFHNYVYVAEQEFKKQIGMVDRTKQAFARKCEQFKNQNYALRKQVASLTDRLNHLSTKQTLYSQNCLKIAQLQQQLKKTSDALSYIIQSTLRIKAETGLYLKVEQIKNYLSYRLQHIENLVKPVVELVGHSGGQVRDLEGLGVLVNRLAVYLGELLK